MFLRGLEGWHIVIIVLLVAVLFGAKRMPDAARSIGQSLRIFKSEMKAASTTDDAEAVSPAANATPAPVPTPMLSNTVAPAPTPVEHADHPEPVPASHAATPTR